jgi:histone-lysine N-methyltransferase SETMAR
MVLTRVEIHKLLHQQFKQGKKAATAARDINALIGRDEVKASTARRWFQLFRQGRVTFTHRKGAGRPVTVNRRALRRRFKRDRTQSAVELSQRLCHPTTARRWLRKLGRKWRRGRNIPHDLTPAQKQNRVDTCEELLRRHRQGRLLSRIITCDESWVYYDGRVKRPQWLLPNEPAQPTPVRLGHAKKRMLCFFWSMQGPVYWELLPKATTINSDFYCSQLDRVNTAAQVMTAQGRRKGRVVFQQDNARPHTSIQTTNHIKKELGWDLLPHPPYSPDIATSDYHVFRALKNFLRGRQFQNDEELENAVREFFVSKLGTDFFERGIRKLPKRWRIVVLQQGEYIID